MALSTTDRSKQVDGVLASLTANRGVTAAAIIDMDGFVVQIRRDFEIDTDALGAGVQVVFSAASRAAEQSGQGSSDFVLVENIQGITMLVPLSNGFVLAIIADKSAMLGALRYEARASVVKLNQMF